MTLVYIAALFVRSRITQSSAYDSSILWLRVFQNPISDHGINCCINDQQADHRCGIVQFGILLTDTAAIHFESFSHLFLRSLIQNYFRYVDRNLFYSRSIFKNILRWPFVRQLKLRGMLGKQSIIRELKKTNIWEKNKIEKGDSNLLLKPSEMNAIKVRSKYGNYLSPF